MKWRRQIMITVFLFAIGTVLGLTRPNYARAAAPANDNWANRITLSASAEITGTLADATADVGGPRPAGANTMSVWYSWTAPATGIYELDTLKTDQSITDTELEVFQGTSLAGLTPWSDVCAGCGPSSDNAWSIYPDGMDSQVVVHANAGAVMTIEVFTDVTRAKAGAFTLDVNHATANDDFANAFDLTGDSSGGRIYLETVSATKQAGEPAHAGNAGGASIWFKWTAPASPPSVECFDTQGLWTNFDTLLAIYTGSSVGSLTAVSSNNDDVLDPGSTRSETCINSPLASTTYRIAVDGNNGAAGLLALRWSNRNPPANDLWANAIPVTGQAVSVSVDPRLSTLEPAEQTNMWMWDQGSQWFSWTAPASGWTVVTYGAGTADDTGAAVFTGSSFASLAYVVRDAGNGGGSDKFTMASNECRNGGPDYFPGRTGFDAVAGTTYWIAAYQLRGDYDPPPLNLTVDQGSANGVPSANDMFAAASIVTPEADGSFDTGCIENYGATTQAGEPNNFNPSTSGTSGASLWWSWTAPSSGLAQLTTRYSDLTIAAGVYTGSSVSALTMVAGSPDWVFDGSDLYLSFNAVAGTTYRISIAGDQGDTSMGDFDFELNPAPDAPNPINDGATTGSDAAWDTSKTTMSATWSPVTTYPVTGYDWCIQTSPANACADAIASGSGTTAGTAVTQAGLTLTEGATYYVCATSHTAFSEGSDQQCSNGQRVDAVPPTAIAPLDAVSRSAGGATLSWTPVTDDVSGVAFYRVYRATSAAGPWTKISSDGSVTSGTYVDSGTASTQNWYYKVQAVDNAGNENTVAAAIAEVYAAPDTLFSAASNAQTGAANPTIDAAEPHFSLINRGDAMVDYQRTEVWSDMVDSDVVALWHLDDATGTDASGHGHTLATYNAPSFPGGQANFANAMNLDGSTQYAQPAISSDFDLANNFTVGTWFRHPAAVVGDEYLLEKGGGGDRNFTLTLESGGHLAALVTTTSGDQFIEASGLPVDDGDWHHAAMTVDASNTLRLYFDGSLVAGPLILAGPVTGGMGDPLSLGRFGTTAGGFFNGELDDARIVKRALSGPQLAGYYRTQEPHGTLMWDSNPSDIGSSLGALCAADARCRDITYGVSGNPGTQLPLLRSGARWYVTAKFFDAGSGQSAWSAPDWFQEAPGMTLSVDDGSVTMPPFLPLNDETATSTVTVTTDAADGYTLTAGDASDTVAMTDGTGDTLADFAGTPATPSAWPAAQAGGFGISVLGFSAPAGKDSGRWGTGTTPTAFANLKYAGLQTSATAPTLLSTRTDPSALTGDTTTITYRADAANFQPAGNYSDSITYTALANP